MSDAKEYEYRYIGLILADEKVLYDTPLDVKHFGNSLAREAFRVAMRILMRGDDVNAISLVDESKLLQNHPGDIGEMSTNHGGNRKFYEKNILREYKKRELRNIAADIQENLDDPDALLSDIDKRITEINAQNESDRIYSMKELVKPAIEQIEKRYYSGGELPGVSTGFPTIDAITTGLREDMLYYIGARPSQGKSAIILNMANNASLHGVPTGIISAESSKEELTLRSFADIANVDSYRISTGMLNKTDFADLTGAGEKMYKAPLYIYDMPNINITKLAAIAKAMKRKYHIKVLFVDYVQLVVSTLHNAPRRDQVAEISITLKNLARELHIPIVAAAQLTRDSENHKPGLRDFAEASQIEKDADVAILLQHEYDDKDELVRVWARIEKNRDGAKGVVRMQFKGKYIRFAEEANHG